jgi:hypothetical protein
MNQIRMVGASLALTCVLGLAIAGAAVASLPEFYQKGAPLEPLVKDKFTGKTGEVQLFNSANVPGSCSSSTSKGEIVGPKTAKKLVVTSFGCTETSGSTPEPCTTGKLPSGETKTKPLQGELVYLGKAGGHPVGLREKPEKGTVIVESKCGSFPNVPVSGESLAEESPLNGETKELNVLFAQNEAKTGPQWSQVEEIGPTIGEVAKVGTRTIPVWEAAIEVMRYKTAVEVRG